MNPSTFNQLSAEHRCLLVLAANLDEQTAALPGGAHTDLRAMHDQARRLREFYTRAHGPKDDAVVAKVLEDARGVRSLMTPFLRTDANGFLRSLLALETALQAAMLGQIVATETIVEHTDEAMRHLRAQIAMEESATYPWARRRLGPRGRLELAREIALIGERWPDDPCAEPASAAAWVRRSPTAGTECTCAA